MLGDGWTYMIFGQTKESLDQYTTTAVSKEKGATKVGCPFHRFITKDFQATTTCTPLGAQNSSYQHPTWPQRSRGHRPPLLLAHLRQRAYSRPETCSGLFRVQENWGRLTVAFYFRSLTTSDWTKAGSPKTRSKKFVLMA